MNKFMKYALIASSGYAIHAFLNREAQLKSDLYVGPTGPTLRTKLVKTVSDHIGSKANAYIFGEPSRPRNAGSRYERYDDRESK